MQHQPQLEGTNIPPNNDYAKLAAILDREIRGEDTPVEVVEFPEPHPDYVDAAPVDPTPTPSPAQLIDELYEKLAGGVQRFNLALPKVDEYVPGVAKGEVMVIGGYASTMKSWLACHFIHAHRDSRGVFCSFEMGVRGIAERLLAQHLKVPLSQIIAINESGDPERLRKVKAHMREMFDTALPNFTLLHKPLSPSQLRAKLDYTHQEGRPMPDWIIIDSFKTLKKDSQGDGFRAAEETFVQLTEIAKDYDMAVIVLHHTHKGEGPWSVPDLTSLRDAGQAEADYVIGLHRPWTNPAYRGVYSITPAQLSEVHFTLLKDRQMGKHQPWDVTLAYRITEFGEFWTDDRFPLPPDPKTGRKGGNESYRASGQAAPF